MSASRSQLRRPRTGRRRRPAAARRAALARRAATVARRWELAARAARPRRLHADGTDSGRGQGCGCVVGWPAAGAVAQAVQTVRAGPTPPCQVVWKPF